MRIVQVIMRTQLYSTFTVYVHIIVGLKFLKSDLSVRLTQLHFVIQEGKYVLIRANSFCVSTLRSCIVNIARISLHEHLHVHATWKI